MGDRFKRLQLHSEQLYNGRVIYVQPTFVSLQRVIAVTAVRLANLGDWDKSQTLYDEQRQH